MAVVYTMCICPLYGFCSSFVALAFHWKTNGKGQSCQMSSHFSPVLAFRVTDYPMADICHTYVNVPYRHTLVLWTQPSTRKPVVPKFGVLTFWPSTRIQKDESSYG